MGIFQFHVKSASLLRGEIIISDDFEYNISFSTETNSFFTYFSLLSAQKNIVRIFKIRVLIFSILN